MDFYMMALKDFKLYFFVIHYLIKIVYFTCKNNNLILIDSEMLF